MLSEEIVNGIIKYIRENIEKINKVSLFDFENFDQKKKENVALIAASCILNGPIGVGKKQHFLDLGSISIREYTGATGMQWKLFCSQLAVPLQEENCLSKTVWGKVWPLCEIDGKLPGRNS